MSVYICSVSRLRLLSVGDRQCHTVLDGLGCSSGDDLDLYSRGALFSTRPGHRLSVYSAVPAGKRRDFSSITPQSFPYKYFPINYSSFGSI
jgi:hypothetical protein